jgi:hypothetical protein
LDALHTFHETNMDALILGMSLLRKPTGAEVAPPASDVESRLSPSRKGLIELELDPGPAKLRRFGFVAFTVFGALTAAASQQWLMFAEMPATSAVSVAAVLALVSVASLIASLVAPRLNRVLWVALSVATFPIGFVMSWLLLGALFFGVMTPIGLAMRLVGRDPLTRGWESEKESYWVKAEVPDDPATYYFRQY